MVATPAALSRTVMSLQLANGATLSTTVTVAVQVALLPLASVTVSVTVLGPTLAQVKLVCEAEKLKPPQASVEPLLRSLAAIVALPDALS